MDEKTFSFRQMLDALTHSGLHRLRRALSQIMVYPTFQDVQSSPLALLVDGENVSSEIAVYLLAEVAKLGGVTVRRVYGNWASSTMQRWQEMASHYGMTAVHHHLPVMGKNATDIALVVDAMALFHDGMRRFCLVSSDSDYTPLVRWLCEHGSFVLGIGKAETPSTLKHTCTAFVSIDQLLPPSAQVKGVAVSPIAVSPTSSVPLSTPSEERMEPVLTLAPQGFPAETPLQKLLVRAYREVALAKSQEWVLMNEFGVMLKKLDPQFKVKEHGSSTLTALVKKHIEVFEVREIEGGQSAIHLKES